MKRSDNFELKCIQCQGKIPFAIDDHGSLDKITCSNCNQEYSFSDPILKGQLKKFSNLCAALIDAEEILSNTSVGINVADREVKVPYKLLLTRLNTTLDLTVGGKKMKIRKRVEPTASRLYS